MECALFSFRQKIFFTYALLFLICILLTFPISQWMVRAIAIQSMTERADELIRDLRTASDNDALVRRLKSLKHQIFFSC